MDQKQRQEIFNNQPTSPPTAPSPQLNVISVLSKMLETHVMTPEQPQSVSNSQTKTFGFYLDFLINNESQKCEVEIDKQKKVEAALVQALQKFKILLDQKGYDMDTTLDNYTLRLAKKNGKPKTDMPSIDVKQKFAQIKVNFAAIQVKNPDSIKQKTEDQEKPVQEFGKSMSYYSIGSEIGRQSTDKKQQLMTEEQLMRQQKKEGNCMFSFC